MRMGVAGVGATVDPDPSDLYSETGSALTREASTIVLLCAVILVDCDSFADGGTNESSSSKEDPEMIGDGRSWRFRFAKFCRVMAGSSESGVSWRFCCSFMVAVALEMTVNKS